MPMWPNREADVMAANLAAADADRAQPRRQHRARSPNQLRRRNLLPVERPIEEENFRPNHVPPIIVEFENLFDVPPLIQDERGEYVNGLFDLAGEKDELARGIKLRDGEVIEECHICRDVAADHGYCLITDIA